MNTEFRCECCGRKMSLSLQEGITAARCPHCGKRRKLPASLAGLPHPHVEADAIEGRPVDQAELVGACAVGDRHDALDDGVISRTMPWILSVLLHLGVAVIMMFLALLTISTKAKEPPHVAQIVDVTGEKEMIRVAVPDVDKRKDRQKDILKPKQLEPGERSNWQQAKPAEPPRMIDNTGPGPKVDLEGRGDKADGKGTDLLNRPPGGGGRGGGGGRKIFPVTPADHVVFVIDRSGSMITTFDTVRLAMYMRVSEMRPAQKFHVILYASGTVEENPPRRLVPAVDDEKQALVDFLKEVRPGNQTDPIPALRRGFAVMRAARDAHKGTKPPVQLIYLLSDGEFPKNDKVLAAIRKSNPKGRRQTHINTILYGSRPPEAVKVMKLIAEENKGRYKYISPDE